MTQQAPDSSRILASLKDFQRASAEHAFRRLWLDDDQVKRFLVADEVGLGKTMVAKGVIARTVEHLWDSGKRIDVVYICSNAQIARQNLTRLNVVGASELKHADRLTLLPKVIRSLRNQRVNFVSFTPGTSFHVGSTGGKGEERALLYRMLESVWKGRVRQVRWQRFFEGGMDRTNFSQMLRWYQPELDDELCRSFVEMLEDQDEKGPGGAPLLEELETCVESFTGLRKRPSAELNGQRNAIVGRLRQLVARASVHHLEPDLVILDEFQRFKDLLDADDAGADLARAVFDHEDAKVLLLSATPYKMYTLPDEPEGDEHYADFTRTVRFLAGEDRALAVERDLRTVRQCLISGADSGTAKDAQHRLQNELRRVMCRTERLALTPDRDGMLQEIPLSGADLTAADLHAWRAFDDVARGIGHHDVFEYWRSTPYPLNLMERGTYEIRKRFQAAVERNDSRVAQALSTGEGLLDWDAIQAYRAIDPGNSKMRGLTRDLLDRGAWQLAWIPASLPYYEPGGAYADPALKTFTKRLVFSAWAVVPKAIAVVLSYGAERRAMEAPLRAMEDSGRTRRTYSERSGATPPLQFRMGPGGAPANMPTLAILYPSLTLARAGDPLVAARELGEVPAQRAAVLDHVRSRIEALLTQLPDGQPGSRPDQSWYWAAPFLLDRAATPDDDELYRAYSQAQSADDNEDVQSRLADHLRAASAVDGLALGPRPSDLSDVLTSMAIGGPGVCALRTLSRSAGGQRSLRHPVLRDLAFRIAQGLRSLFNRPETVALLRSTDDDSYWRAVLDHCVDGNLQAVLDEYAHVLAELEGLFNSPRLDRAEELARLMIAALTTRAAPNSVDEVTVRPDRIDLTEHRMTSHFAARYGRAESTDKAAQRESTMRVAFNSPFRPFVLASTSVGQEGLDFHSYCHAIVHWNLPGNPVDLEQREGRVHRYKGHAVRKNVALFHAPAALNPAADDPWDAVFSAAEAETDGESSITPYWVYSPPGGAVIERYVPAAPLSREANRYRRLQRTVGAYRLVIGQPRQEDLVRYVGTGAGAEDWLQMDLTPTMVPAAPATGATSPSQVFDPEHDEPLLPPSPWPDPKTGDPRQALMAVVILHGGVLAINLRQGRGATQGELSLIGQRAGRNDMRGIGGQRIETREDGRWLTHTGRRELEEAARHLRLELPDDLAW